MDMTRFSSFLFFSLLPAAMWAADYRVSAAAVDSLGNPESFVTWRIFALPDTVKPVAGAVTGDEGLINVSLAAPGDYRLSLVGMTSQPAERRFTLSETTPSADLGKIVLRQSSTSLNEITVTAQRPLVVKEIDRIGYDVQADSEAPTSTLSEILQKVPMVTVEADGTILVNGSSNFKIYKNGRPNNAFTNNAKDIFKAIPASSIKKVEVITDPGAREDAEGVGAILNIVTDSQTAVKGVMGNANVSFDTRNAVPMANLWLTSQVDKVAFSMNGGYYNFSKHESEYTTWQKGTYQSSGRELYTTSEGYSKNNAGYGGFEASYEPDTLNLITVEGNFYLSSSDPFSATYTSLSEADGSPVYSYGSRTGYRENRYLDFGGVANYQRSTRLKGETITLSYQISTTNQKRVEETEYFDLVNPPMMYSGIDADSHLKYAEHTVQLDWTRPLGDKHKIDVGGKFVHRNNHSKTHRDYIGANETEDDFIHRTSIGAAYFDYRLKLKKFGARAGLRYEFSRLSAEYLTGDARKFGSNLNDFAPNVAVSYNPDDANTVKLSYNRRIYRPGVYYLDPTVNETPLVTSQGNPELKSSTQNQINLNYSLIKAKFNLDFTLGANFSNDNIGQFKTVVDEHTYYTYGNINHSRQFNVSLYCQWSPFSKTQVMMNIWGGLFNYKYPTVGLSETRGTINPYINISQRLPWKLQLRAYGSWYSGNIGGVYSYSKMGADGIHYGLSLQRTFLKEDRLTVRVSANRPFGPKTRQYRNYGINSDHISEQVQTARRQSYFGLSFSYRFGSLNVVVKKTAARINNDDVSGQKL